MADNERVNHLIRRTAVTTVALALVLVYGITVLASGDWIPGGITVGAALIALAVQIRTVRKLCRPTGSQRRGHPTVPHG